MCHQTISQWSFKIHSLFQRPMGNKRCTGWWCGGAGWSQCLWIYGVPASGSCTSNGWSGSIIRNQSGWPTAFEIFKWDLQWSTRTRHWDVKILCNCRQWGNGVIRCWTGGYLPNYWSGWSCRYNMDLYMVPIFAVIHAGFFGGVHLMISIILMIHVFVQEIHLVGATIVFMFYDWCRWVSGAWLYWLPGQGWFVARYLILHGSCKILQPLQSFGHHLVTLVHLHDHISLTCNCPLKDLNVFRLPGHKMFGVPELLSSLSRDCCVFFNHFLQLLQLILLISGPVVDTGEPAWTCHWFLHDN